MVVEVVEEPEVEVATSLVFFSRSNPMSHAICVGCNAVYLFARYFLCETVFDTMCKLLQAVILQSMSEELLGMVTPITLF